VKRKVIHLCPKSSPRIYTIHFSFLISHGVNRSRSNHKRIRQPPASGGGAQTIFGGDSTGALAHVASRPKPSKKIKRSKKHKKDHSDSDLTSVSPGKSSPKHAPRRGQMPNRPTHVGPGPHVGSCRAEEHVAISKKVAKIDPKSSGAQKSHVMRLLARAPEMLYVRSLTGVWRDSIVENGSGDIVLCEVAVLRSCALKNFSKIF
jgi:hypothetical protein